MQRQKTKHFSFFNARLISIISIALVLFMLGLIVSLSLLATEVSRYVKENIGFSVVLSEQMSEDQIHALSTRIEKNRYIKSVYYTSKEQALKELIDELGENPETFLGFNPLNASMELKLKAEYANTDSVAWIEQELIKYKGIREVNYQKDLIHLVNENVKRIGAILLGLALVLMVISFALISNTVRLSAYAKRFLIHTMKLVGATPAFIRKPFVINGIVNGLFGALLASLLLGGVFYYVASQVDHFDSIFSWQASIVIFGIVLLLGVLLTALSSFFAVSRYIRMNRDDLYTI